MQGNNAVEEGTSDDFGSVRMAKSDEAGVLGEATNDKQDDQFTPQPSVGPPNNTRNIQGLQEIRHVRVLSFIALS